MCHNHQLRIQMRNEAAEGFITHIYIYFKNNCFRNDHARRNLFVPKHSSPTSNILQLGDELAWKKTSLKLLTIP